MRAEFHQALLGLAHEDQRVVLVGSDLGAGALADFRRDFPDRCFMEGVSEQALVGMCAGMASCGLHPFFQTLATFLTRRAYEQIFIDLGLQALPVRLIGAGGGLVYSRLGPTHTAVDDILLMRAVPGLKVLVPMNPSEAVHLLRASKDYEGPIYFRLSKGPFPQAPSLSFPALGDAMALTEGRGPLIVATGLMSSFLLESLESLRVLGLDPALLHFPCVKPLDRRALTERLADRLIVIAVEEHLRTGGLGTAIGESLYALEWPGRFHSIGIPESIEHLYGDHFEALERVGLDPTGLTRQIAHVCASAT